MRPSTMPVGGLELLTLTCFMNKRKSKLVEFKVLLMGQARTNIQDHLPSKTFL